MKPRIAQVSSDLNLAHSREEVLRDAGYETCTFSSASDLATACAEQNFDLLLIGHSLEFTGREQVRTTFRKFNNRAPVVQLVSDYESGDDEDYSLNIYNGPGALVGLLNRLLEGNYSRASSVGK